MDGVHVKIVSERAGHANISITLSVYATFLPNLQDKAAEGVDDWLREALAEEVGGKSVAKVDFGTGRSKLTR
jgi:integrase